MKGKLEFLSYMVLLGGAIIFGLLGRSIEMGLAIVAGAISLSFLNVEKFRRIKGAGFEAELKEQIVAVVEKETEPSGARDSIALGENRDFLTNPVLVDQNAQSVINALQNREYTWRYIEGIQRDTGLSAWEINEALDWLTLRGYARKSRGKHGDIWSLTEQGRYLSRAITHERVSAS